MNGACISWPVPRRTCRKQCEAGERLGPNQGVKCLASETLVHDANRATAMDGDILESVSGHHLCNAHKVYADRRRPIRPVVQRWSVSMQ